jgi:hypothetical protein
MFGRLPGDGTRTHKQTQTETGWDERKSIAEWTCKLGEPARWSGTHSKSKLRGSGERQGVVRLPSKGIQKQRGCRRFKGICPVRPAGHISEFRPRDPLDHSTTHALDHSRTRPLTYSTTHALDHLTTHALDRPTTRPMARPIVVRNGRQVCPHATQDHSVVFRPNRVHFRCATHIRIQVHMSFSETIEALPDPSRRDPSYLASYLVFL